MSQPGDRAKTYFIDPGGIVHSGPIKSLEPTPEFVPKLILRGDQRDDLNHQVLTYAQRLRRIVSRSAQFGRSAQNSQVFVRGRFLTLALPDPGLIEIEDGVYTGWFITQARAGLGNAFRGDYQGRTTFGPHFSPYFKLDSEQASEWNIKAQGPIPAKELELLHPYSYTLIHPLADRLRSVGLEVVVAKGKEYLDSFWERAKDIMNNGAGESLADFLEPNLMTIAILQRVHSSMHRDLIAQIGQMMESVGITILPLSDDSYAVMYRVKRDDEKTVVRSLPIPNKYAHLLQRYRVLGEKPMLREEIASIYRRLVDPQTNLF